MLYIEQDKLNRNVFVDTLEKIINKKFSEQDGFSFAIDGKWGCGKTFIVNMLEERLKNKYLVIKYNCWKYDYYEEPVMAIMSVIADTLNQIAAEKEPPHFVNQDTFKNIAKFLIETGAILFNTATGIDLKSILDLGKEVINKEYQEAISKDFDTKDTLTKAIDIIRMALCIAHCDTGVLFIVDELDRCLPEYAIKVLERLHHVNEGSQFITMLSINKHELAGSIANVFGKHENDTDFADYYLQKFTNLIIPVPNGKVTNTLLDKFKFSKRYFDIDSNDLFSNDFENFFSDVLGKLSIRTIEIIDKQINAINALVTSNGGKPSKIAFCAAILRVYEKNIAKGQITISNDNDVLYSAKITYINSRSSIYIEDSFNEALANWSCTGCCESRNRRDTLIGFCNILNLFQDYVKAILKDKNSNMIITLTPPLQSQDINYIKEFTTWLNQINLIEE
jgi:Predicted P-loop ATPase